jgi:hypothetical protein
MATFGELKAKIGDWLSASTARLSDTVRGDLINMQQRELLRLHDLRFGEFVEEDATSPAGVRGSTLPANFSRPILLWRLGEDFAPLKQIQEFDSFIARYPDASKTGTPGHYLIVGNEIWFGPTPATLFAYKRSYYGTLPDMTADGDSNQFTIQAWEVLLWGALVFATKYMIEDTRAPVFQENFDRTLSQLLTEHSRARSSAGELVSREPG